MAGSAIFKDCWLRLKLDGVAGTRSTIGLKDSSRHNTRLLSGGQALSNMDFSSSQTQFLGSSLHIQTLLQFNLDPLHPPACPVNGFTVSLWLYPTNGANSTQKGIFSFANRAGAFLMRETSGNRLGIVYVRNGALVTLTSTTTGLTNNAWNHLCVSWDGTNIRLYKDGVSIASASVTVSSSNLSLCDNPSGVHYLGSNAVDPNGCTGYYSDFSVYADSAIYSGTSFTVPAAPEVDYFRVINGTVSESAPLTQWKVSAHDWHTGRLVGTDYPTGTSYKVKVATDKMCYVVLTPLNTILESSAGTYCSALDSLMPDDAPTNPHIWASPGDIFYSDNPAATPVAPSNYTDAFSNVWTYVGGLERPVCEGPLLPIDE